jgi:hypothetical protein
VASETLTDERFYDRFFTLLDRFLEGGGADAPPDMPAEAPAAAPAPATSFPVAPSPNRG